jgi:CRISPR system Cascade subunit CasC
MTERPKFLQIHTLTSYPGTLLNRDDAGFAKRLPFGGATRTRVSSQCLKFHWRNFRGEGAIYGLDVDRSLRSRRTFRLRVARPLLDDGYPQRLVEAAVLTVRELVLSDKAPSKTAYKNALTGEGEDLDTNQITVLGEAETRYMRQIIGAKLDELKTDFARFWDEPEATANDDEMSDIIASLKELTKGDTKDTLRSMKLASGLDAAMFGRMTTSDALARGDAAIHVAHAFTTHAEESESDYFTAVDELVAEGAEGELGSGLINNTELTSGLFYGYVVVDVPLLVSNIEGCAQEDWLEADLTLANEVLARTIRSIATVSPGAKLGSTAPYSRAEFLLVEAGNAQPRTLANAFRKPVSTTPDVRENSYRALGKYVNELDQMYGDAPARRLAAIGADEGLLDALKLSEAVSVADAVDWVNQKVGG